MSNRNENPASPPSPFLIERLMREARHGREDLAFSSEEEFRHSLSGFIDEGLPARRLESLRDDPVELAQEFAFEAYEGPAYVAPGSEQEALVCADILGEAWARPGPARHWLQGELTARGLIPEADA